MPYTPFHADWKDYPDTTTPVTAAALEYIEAGIQAAAATADAASAASAGYVPKTVVDAKGDILVGTAADTVSIIAVGANGKVLVADSTQTSGHKWIFPPAYEYAVASITSDAAISATAESAANTILTASSVSFDGTQVVVLEFFCPRVIVASGSGAGVVFSLWDSGTEVCRLGVVLNNGEATGNLSVPVRLSHRFTPSNTSHTYSVRAHVTTGTATITAGAGTGGSGVNPPTTLRVLQA